MIILPLPNDARRVFAVCLARFRVHPMSGGMDGPGISYNSKLQRVDKSYTNWRWVRHSGLSLNLGLRPIEVERAGFISLTAQWDFRGGRGDPTWRFRGWGMGLNYPGHTGQRGPCDWDNRGTKGNDRVESLLDTLENTIVEQFVTFECSGLSCSHRDAVMRDDDALTEPGLTTSDAPPLFHRVW